MPTGTNQATLSQGNSDVVKTEEEKKQEEPAVNAPKAPARQTAAPVARPRVAQPRFFQRPAPAYNFAGRRHNEIGNPDDPRYLPRDPVTENMQGALSRLTGRPVGIARVTNEYGDFVSVNLRSLNLDDARNLARRLNDNGNFYKPLGQDVHEENDYNRVVTPSNYIEVLQEIAERIAREIKTDKPIEFNGRSLKLQPDTPDLKSYKTGKPINEGPKMDLPEIPRRPSRMGVFLATLFGGMFGIRAETYAEKMAKRMEAIERFNKTVKEFNEGERKARNLAYAGARVQADMAEERRQQMWSYPKQLRSFVPNQRMYVHAKTAPSMQNRQPQVQAQRQQQAQPIRTQEQPTRTQEQPTRTQAQPTRTQEQPTITQEQPTRTQVQPTRTQEQPTRTQAQPTHNQTQPTRTQRTNALPKLAEKQQWQPSQRTPRPKITQEKLAARRAAMEQQNQKFRQLLQKQQANLNRLREKQSATKQTATKKVETKQTATKQTATKKVEIKQTATKQTESKESRRVARENERLDKQLQKLQKESEKLTKKGEHVGKLLSLNTLTQEDEINVDQELDQLMEELNAEEKGKTTQAKAAVRAQEKTAMDFNSLAAEEGVKPARVTEAVKNDPEKQFQKCAISR